jgi:hypothetical protein
MIPPIALGVKPLGLVAHRWCRPQGWNTLRHVPVIIIGPRYPFVARHGPAFTPPLPRGGTVPKDWVAHGRFRAHIGAMTFNRPELFAV